MLRVTSQAVDRIADRTASQVTIQTN